MNSEFKFCNLLGTVFHNGNLCFSHSGDDLISPVGNRISVFQLKTNRSETLPIESQFNITVLELDPTSHNLFAINEHGEALYINLVSRQVIHRHRFNKRVRCLKFSPDGKRFAVCRDNDVQIFRSPGLDFLEHNIPIDNNPFFLEDCYHVSSEETTCLSWSDDSRIFAVGSKDMVTRVCGAQRYENMFMFKVAGHTGQIINCFFEAGTFDLMTVDKNGFLVTWQCSINGDMLIDKKEPSYVNDTIILEGEDLVKPPVTDEVNASSNVLYYTKLRRHSFHDAVPGPSIYVTACDYHRTKRLLVAGFSSGSFALFEMPEFSLIHTLNMSDSSILSLTLNRSGDWIAAGCGGAVGQLLVWEWQSETYVLKQEGHLQNMQCLAYSPDGHLIATGGQDAKVKIWSVISGFSVVTFTDHSGAISAVVFTQAGKAVLSASYDGTVRAFDMKRYRNFRTFTSTRPVQFSCLAVDAAGDLVCAGALDHFDICLWSMQTGRLLQVFSGHEAPVSSVVFNPTVGSMASASWDKTVRIWDVFENKDSPSEAIRLSSDALCVRFSPNGQELTVCTLDCNITFFDWRAGEQIRQIEGRLDLDPGRGQSDVITPSKSGKAKAFTTICYSADGAYILAGGQSRNVCLYNVEQCLILKSYPISCNYSLDAVADDVDRRNIADFGGLYLVDALDSDEEEMGARLKLPGTKAKDPGQRFWLPEVRVSVAEFSPTGRSWAACSTEGLLIYSLDHSVIFDPFELDTNVTPRRILEELEKEEFSTALSLALRLNDDKLIRCCLEKVPVGQVRFVIQPLSLIFIERLLSWLAKYLEITRHIQLGLVWIQTLFLVHTTALKALPQDRLSGPLVSIQQALSKKQREIAKLCEQNRYSLEYIISVHRMTSESKRDEQGTDKDDDDDDVGDAEEALLATTDGEADSSDDEMMDTQSGV